MVLAAPAEGRHKLLFSTNHKGGSKYNPSYSSKRKLNNLSKSVRLHKPDNLSLDPQNQRLPPPKKKVRASSYVRASKPGATI